MIRLPLSFSIGFSEECGVRHHVLKVFTVAIGMRQWAPKATLKGTLCRFLHVEVHLAWELKVDVCIRAACSVVCVQWAGSPRVATPTVSS